MANIVDGSFTGGSAVEGALQTLAAIESDDTFWDDVEPFVAHLRQLAADKLAARELRRKEQEVSRSLERVCGAGAESLAFHEASDVLTWSAASFDAPAWPAVIAVCGELHDGLVRHATLQHDPASNRSEARKRRALLEALEEEIAGRLITLRGLLASAQPATSAAPPVTAREPIVSDFIGTAAGDDERAALDPAGEHYSVFTSGEEERLVASRPGVCLVFGSVATGLESVPDAMISIARRRVALREVPRNVEPTHLPAWIAEHAPSVDPAQMIFWQRLGRWSTELQAGLQQLIQRHEAGGARIVLVGGPPEARAFLSGGKSQDLVNANLDVVPCSRWTLAAIEARMRDTQLDAGGHGAAEIMSATRGWHRLVEVLWARKSKHRDVASMIAAFDSTFRSPGGYSGFRAALGLGAFPEAETVFRLLAGRSYSPMAPDAIPRWLTAKGGSVSEDLVTQTMGFLHLFQLVELDAEGRVVLDAVAREVLGAEL